MYHTATWSLWDLCLLYGPCNHPPERRCESGAVHRGADGGRPRKCLAQTNIPLSTSCEDCLGRVLAVFGKFLKEAWSLECSAKSIPLRLCLRAAVHSASLGLRCLEVTKSCKKSLASHQPEASDAKRGLPAVERPFCCITALRTFCCIIACVSKQYCY